MNNINEKREFEAAIRSLEAQSVNVGFHMVMDGDARQLYSKQIKKLSEELRASAKSGKISWKEAAAQANEIRNVVMDIVRGKSTAVGNAYAQKLKSKGKTLNEMIAKKTIDTFKDKNFADLTFEQKNKVYAEVVKSSGKSRPNVNLSMKKISIAGRGLVVLAIALSVYTVATADNKIEAAGKELAISGASIGGGVAGGALAGLACGPGAPVCVGIGAFIGGALAALGVSVIW